MRDNLVIVAGFVAFSVVTVLVVVFPVFGFSLLAGVAWVVALVGHARLKAKQLRAARLFRALLLIAGGLLALLVLDLTIL